MIALVKSLVVGVLLVGFSSLVNAQDQGGVSGPIGDPPLPLTGAWQDHFDENNGGVGSFFNETWTFTGSAELRITDTSVPGDQFAIYDNGILIGNSSVVPDWSTYESSAITAPPYTQDPAVAWLDPHFSHFDMILGDQSHSITIQMTVLPSGFFDGTYAISAVAVPEASSMTTVLLGMGMLALGGLRRVVR